MPPPRRPFGFAAPQAETGASPAPTDGGDASTSQPVIVPTAEDATRVRESVPSGSGTAVLQFIGEYAVVKKIGEGGMGSVYLAEDPKLGRKAAIKTMKPELAADKTNRDRFEREARAAAAVEHENIVPIWGIGEAADGSPFIAMPFLQGETLGDRLRRQPVAGLSAILKVAREVADGLAAAHAKGLIHRDIKPGNVWLEGDPSAKELAAQIRRCKILDFGLARSVNTEEAQLTASGAIVGTPAYMAPEQAMGEKVDNRTDLFSLGIVLYRMTTGKMPFNGSTPVAVMIALTTETPTPSGLLNPNAPPALTALIDKLLCKDPAGRPQSGTEVSATVRKIVKDLQGRNPMSVAAARPIPVEPAAPIPAEPAAPVPVPAPSSGEEVTEAELVSAPKAPRLAAAPARAAEAAEPKPHRKPKRKPVAKQRRAPYVVAGLLALVALVGTLAFIRLSTAKVTLDPKQVEKKPDPAVPPVVVTPVVAPPVVVTPPADPVAERRAAEWALRAGGSVVVRVGDRAQAVGAGQNLPAGPFTVSVVQLNALGERVTDDGLVNLKGCSDLRVLLIWGSVVSDAGIAHLKGLTALTFLTLNGRTGCITDAGVKDLKAMTQLTELTLNYSSVTNDGLAHLKGCTKLATLGITYTKVTGPGLATFKGSTTLRNLYLEGNAISDDDMEYVVGLPELRDLSLIGTRIGDRGLMALAKLKSLTWLKVAKTRVTPEGVRALARQLPGCKIEWDGGAIEPTQK